MCFFMDAKTNDHLIEWARTATLVSRRVPDGILSVTYMRFEALDEMSLS